MEHNRMIHIKPHYGKHYTDDKSSLNDDYWLEEKDVFEEKVIDSDDDIAWENDWSFPFDKHSHYFYGY